jgi:arginine deiminase
MDEIKYSQYTETEQAKLVLIHEPSYEIFMSMLHPAGSLYKDVTSESLIHKDFENLKQIMKIHGIRILTVREALLMDRPALIKLAMNSLQYLAEEGEKDTSDSLFSYYLSDEYKETILNKMSNDQLVDAVLTKPFFTLKRSKKNTFIETSKISFMPLGNLIYVRDPQIATQKGIVIGRSECLLRRTEKIVINQVLKNINAKVIGEMPEKCYMEGGDFFTLRHDLAILGIGIRSNFEAAYYLMEKDLIGCDRLALCIDYDDQDQERMHLDTFFNVLSENAIVIIDFDDLTKLKGKRINRKIQVYSKKEELLLIRKPLSDTYYGDYCLIAEFDDMYKYLESEGFKYIKCSLAQQENFIFNFLNIGDKLIIAINKELKQLVKNNNIDAKVIDLEFEAVKNLYGGVRCATQVYRNILAASPAKRKQKKNTEQQMLVEDMDGQLKLN